MDKLTAMRTFVSVVQNSGFSGAGRAMGVPKTRVSQRIQELEADLNVRLLQRSTRTVTPTDEGRIYFDKCVEILEDIDAAEQAMSRAGEQPEGRLHITVMSSVAHGVILPRLTEFLGAYPAVSIRISVTDRLSSLVEEGIDCAIRGGPLDNSSLISRHLCDVPFGLYAAPAYLAGRPPIVTLEDLDTIDHLSVYSHRTGQSSPWVMSGATGVDEIRAPWRVECDDDQALLTACLAGSGVALCPAISAELFVQSGQLVRVLPDWHSEARPVFLVYPSRRYLAAKLRCFIDWASQILSDAASGSNPLPAVRER